MAFLFLLLVLVLCFVVAMGWTGMGWGGGGSREVGSFGLHGKIIYAFGCSRVSDCLNDSARCSLKMSEHEICVDI